MKEQAFAFLDLLGFSNQVTSNRAKYAYNMLNQIYVVLDMKEMNEAMRSQRKVDKLYEDYEINKLNEQIEITSFSYLQCVSDSIFIAGYEIDKMINQIANLVRECYELNWANKKENLPLVLLRGGISYGEVEIINSKSYLNEKSVKIPNIFGSAVVNAVSYEKKFGIKGPRIVLDDGIYNKLKNETKRYYVTSLKIDERKSNGKQFYEILWPAFKYSIENINKDIINKNNDGEIKKLGNLLSKAYLFFEEYKDSNYHEHYDELISIILYSTKNLFYKTKGNKIFDEYIEKITNNNDNIKGKQIWSSFSNLDNPNHINELNWNDDFRDYIKEIYDHRIINSEGI